MQPSFDLRIRTMNKALTEVVMPAIEPDNKGAVEQLQLVIGSLQLMQEQIDYAHWFEIVDGRSMTAMARKAHDIAEASLPAPLEAAIAEVEDVGSRHDVTLTAIRDANYRLREALSDAIRALLDQAKEGKAAEISRCIVAMTQDQTSRERAFVAKTGFDVFPDSLKSIPESLSASPAA